jgi:hypothetical protein
VTLPSPVAFICSGKCNRRFVHPEFQGKHAPVKPLIAWAARPCSALGSRVESCVVAGEIDYEVAFTHETMRSGGWGPRTAKKFASEKTVGVQ